MTLSLHRHARAVIAILLIGLGWSPAEAATATLTPTPYQTVLDTNGNPVSGAKVCTYVSGTTTPVATYTDAAALVPNGNPITADSAGRFVAYLIPGTSYKFIYQDATGTAATCNGVVLKTIDPIVGVPSSAASVDLTCTAGETISAGQAVYISDGSGSKIQGQCYKADTANGYSSSTALVVGLAPSAIASGLPGTLRLAGSVTGLSSLSVGSSYYVGASGALTTTPPAGARALGTADTATSLVLSLPQALQPDNGIDDFRLTLETGVPVSNTDQTAKTTLYATPSGKGNRIALYSTTGATTIFSSVEFSIAVPATTNTLYDVFAYSNSGTPTLELTAWRNSGQAITGATNATPIVITANAHGLSNGDQVYIAGVVGNTAANGTWTVANIAANTFELATSIGNGAYTAATGFLSARTSTGKLVLTTTGTYTKTADLTRRYLGSFSTTGVSGQTEDSASKRYVWNYYNRQRRSLLRRESTATYTYTLATWRQTHADTANQVEAVIGVADAPVALTSMSLFTTATASLAVAIGIGVDTTTIPNTSLIGGSGDSGTGNVFTPMIIRGDLFTNAGRHTFAMLEFSTASGTTTWYGGGSLVTAIVETGITGFIEG